MRTLRRWWWSPVLAAGFVVVLLSGTFQAADRPDAPAKVEKKEGSGGHKNLDREIYASLRTVINQGADIFNLQGDHVGCYRLYQGALVAVKPLLKHHPKLQ